MTWIEKIYKTYDANKQTQCSFNNLNNKLITYDANNKEDTNIFMPVWKYKNKITNKYEYIWFINNIICSNNYNELLKLCIEIYKLSY